MSSNEYLQINIKTFNKIEALFKQKRDYYIQHAKENDFVKKVKTLTNIKHIDNALDFYVLKFAKIVNADSKNEEYYKNLIKELKKFSLKDEYLKRKVFNFKKRSRFFEKMKKAEEAGDSLEALF